MQKLNKVCPNSPQIKEDIHINQSGYLNNNKKIKAHKDVYDVVKTMLREIYSWK